MATKILDQGHTGHRHDWYKQIKELTNSKQITLLETKNFFSLIKLNDPLIISFFDEKKYIFLSIIFIRILLLKKTIALFFSWSNKFSPKKFSLKILEYAFFSFLAYLLPIKLISSNFNQSKRFLTDLSFFDLSDIEFSKRDEKYFLGYFGSASNVKNFSLFLEYANEIASKNRNIIIQTNSDLSNMQMSMIEKNKYINLNQGFLSKNEFIDVMAATKSIWALYGEEYDQSSGIFGQAAQLKKVIIVRHGSILAGSKYFNTIPIYKNVKVTKIIEQIEKISDTKESIEYNDFLNVKNCREQWTKALKNF
jgi:hypothetical protein